MLDCSLPIPMILRLEDHHMPFVRLQTSVEVPADKREQLLSAMTRIVAEVIGKPERYVMAALGGGDLMMAGRGGPAAFVEVRSIGGLDPVANKRLAHRICLLLHDRLDLPQDRIFLNFLDVPATHWGWDGDTFA